MSLSVVPAHWLQVGIAAAEGDGGFEAPGTEDFYWPVIGGDSNWAITRPMLVMAISVVVLAWFFVTVAGKLTIVPSKRQWVAEQAYGFVRNSIARDVIGAKDFRQFIPLLFTLFTLILFNNVMGVHAVRAVPDDEPDRVPDRADPDRLRRLPHGRDPPEARRHRLPQVAGAPRACRCGCARSCSSSRC